MIIANAMVYVAMKPRLLRPLCSDSRLTISAIALLTRAIVASNLNIMNRT